MYITYSILKKKFKGKYETLIIVIYLLKHNEPLVLQCRCCSRSSLGCCCSACSVSWCRRPSRQVVTRFAGSRSHPRPRTNLRAAVITTTTIYEILFLIETRYDGNSDAYLKIRSSLFS